MRERIGVAILVAIELVKRAAQPLFVLLVGFSVLFAIYVILSGLTEPR